MIHLLHAELTRFTSRKIVWIAFGLVLLALAGMIALLSLETAAPSAAERTDAQTYFEESRSDWEANHVQYEKECRADPSVPDADQNCVYPEPQMSDYLNQLSFTEVGPLVALIGVGFLGLASAIVASSMIGADFSTGSMSNWLSFIPVRWRVYASKLVVTVVGPVILSAAISALAIATMGLIVTAQQGSAAVTGWDQVWGAYGRGIVVIGFGAILGGTVGFITRRTIAAVGIILGYLIVKLLMTSIFGFSAWFAATQPWWPENNALAVLQADYVYQVAQQTVTAAGTQIDYVERTLHWEHVLVYLLVGAAVLLAAGLVTFTRRDVT